MAHRLYHVSKGKIHQATNSNFLVLPYLTKLGLQNRCMRLIVLDALWISKYYFGEI